MRRNPNDTQPARCGIGGLKSIPASRSPQDRRLTIILWLALLARLRAGAASEPCWHRDTQRKGHDR